MDRKDQVEDRTVKFIQLNLNDTLYLKTGPLYCRLACGGGLFKGSLVDGLRKQLSTNIQKQPQL